MNFFYLSPDDRDWLKRWLVKHAVLLLLIACFWLIMYAWPKTETSSARVGEPDRPQAVGLRQTHDASAPDTSAPAGHGHRLEPARAWGENGTQAIQLVDLPMPWFSVAESSAAESSAAESRAAESRAAESSSGRLPSVVGSVTAVNPTGWRRTRNGWENTATWRTSLASLGEIVRQQQEREPRWFKKLLASVRGIPPWGVALLQLTAVIPILIFERWAAAHRSQQAIRTEAA
jgi:hypothetical protein